MNNNRPTVIDTYASCEILASFGQDSSVFLVLSILLHMGVRR